MRLRIVTASLLIIFCAVLEVCTARAQETNTSKVSKPESTSPIVNAWEPKTGSVDSLIYLSGYRLYAGEWNKTKAVFIQNGVEIPAQTGGGSKTLNNLANGPQTLVVIISEELVPGQAQIVVEFDGHRSNPATITVTEWKLPIIKSLNPTSGAPGTLVEIECEGFHISDEVEATDAEGKLIRIGGGGSSRGTAFGIPEDLPEGPVTVRIGNRKYGKGQLTEPLTFTVTNEPRTVDVWPSEMQVVAPGQWLDLQVSNIEPLKRSERTEVSFKQAEQTIIVAAPKPFRTHIPVPNALSAGLVQLQLRTWRDGRPSQWSEPAEFELANKPQAPLIDSIRDTKGQWVALMPAGPDRATSFTVSPGNEVVLHGLWPVADASKLKILLVRTGEALTLTASDFDEKANWFGDVQVHLPETVRVGEWRMIVRSETDGTQAELPIVIRVVTK
jgi:hypothetical protein